MSLSKYIFKPWLLGLRIFYFLILLTTFGILFERMHVMGGRVFSPATFGDFMSGVWMTADVIWALLLIYAGIGYRKYLKTAFESESGEGKVVLPGLLLCFLTVLPFLSIFGVVLVWVEFLPKATLILIFPATIIWIVGGYKLFPR
jgi:hypothetical protein